MLRPAAPTEPVLAKAEQGYRAALRTQAVRIACKAGSVVLLARVVSPGDHGAFAMAATLFGLLSLFRDLGLATATIQAPALRDEQRDTLFWAHLVLSALLCATMFGLAPLAARFYATPRLAPLVGSMGIGFLAIGAGGYVRSQLVRDLQFGVVNRIETYSVVLGTTAMIATGALGGGAFAFVAYLLVSEIVTTVLSWRAQPWRPSRRPVWRSLRGLAPTGAGITVHQALAYASQQLDAIVIGRCFGEHSLGLYNRAGQLLALPNLHVATPLGQVLLASLSRLPPNSEPFARHAWATVTRVAHLVLPLFAVCLALPDETVRLVLGPQWPAAAPLVQALALGGVAATITSLGYSINVATGHTHRLATAAAAALPVTAIAVWLGARHGVLGVAIGIAAANALLVVPRLWWLLRDLPGGPAGFGRALTGPFLAMGAAGIGLWSGSAILDASVHWSWRLTAGLSGGAAALIVLALISPRVRREWRAVWDDIPLHDRPASDRI